MTEMSETTLTLLLAVALYLLFVAIDWGLGKVERWRNRRKENRK